jgi:hypothetical protein
VWAIQVMPGIDLVNRVSDHFYNNESVPIWMAHTPVGHDIKGA